VSGRRTRTYLALLLASNLAARARADATVTPASASRAQADPARSNRSLAPANALRAQADDTAGHGYPRADQPDARPSPSQANPSDPATRVGYAANAQSAAPDSDESVRAPGDVDDASVRGIDITPEELARLLARYAREPTPATVVSAALRAQRRDPEAFADLANRARMRGLVPSLDVGARRGEGVDLRSATTDVLGMHLTTADDLTLFATLRFDLGRLVFAREELLVAREERVAREAQNELVRQVVHLYFLRRRLMLERDLRGRIELGRELRIAEAEALLDTFTGGYFGRMIGDSHGQPTPAPTLPSRGSRGSRD
jgi:hypothetical protein